MSDTIILQRVIPNYRQPLFAALYERFGWITVAASNPPQGTFLKTDPERSEHVRLFPFEFRDPGSQYSCRLPLGRIVEELAPRRIVSEFSMRMNVGWKLPLLRARGRIDSYALWSHGWNMERGRSTAKGVLSNSVRLAPMSLADVLLTYSDEGRDWLKGLLPWKDVIAIGNTLDLRSIRAAARNADPNRSGSPQLLCVGRLTAEKQLDRVISIFRQVKQKVDGAALTIIGEGPERNRLEELARNVAGIRFTGALYDESDLAPHFTGADFFLLAGAAGLSVNHALAYALPVLAYHRGPDGPLHHPEIEYVVDGVTGLFAANQSIEAMAELVVEAHERGSSAKLRETIAAFADQRLPLQVMIDNFAKVDEAL